MIDPARICKRLDELKTLRSPHERTWRECFDYTYPILGSGLQGNDLTADQAKQKGADLVDSTGTDSARILASGAQSGLTSANSRWFALDVGKETDEERRWLDEVAQLMFELIHASNFDASSYEAILNAVIAGWFALYVDEDRERGGYVFQSWPIAQLYVASSKAHGRTDTVYREYKRTAEQVVAEFGEAAVSEKTRRLANEKPQEMIELVRVIQPRDTYKRGSPFALDMPFESCVIEVKDKRLLRESGYHEMPVIVPHWMMIPNSAYAVGPVFDALPVIKSLNELCRMELAATDIAVAGMWKAKDDGVIPRTVQIGPRKVVFMSDTSNMEALTTGSDFNVSFSIKADMQREIRKLLMADQLQPADGPAMTATEVHVRVGLIRQLLGPVYGRLQSEYLQPLIERCFGLAFRAGALPPPPQSLVNRDLTVRYISPLARAQRLEDVTAIERLNANIAQIMQVDPHVVDMIDTDEEINVLQEALGAPAKIMRTKDAVEKIRAARAQMQQQAQQQELMAPAIASAGQAIGKRVANG